MTVEDFLSLAARRVLLDVRAPGEYSAGHIPGAQGFPLFTDEERAHVGTAYKKYGKDAAFVIGLQYVGPKMAGMVQTARSMAPDLRVAIHCWRGGQRSQSVGWLLRQAGFDVAILPGGYKNYRQCVLNAYADMHLTLLVIGGRTGSGKTKILHALRDMGEQILDLEGLANHKGSAFGFIGEAPQPTVEQFENDLYHAVTQLDPTRRVWLENESRSIGRVFIPDAFWNKMKAATLFNIEVSKNIRIQNLLNDYVLEQSAELEAAFLKIDRKLGGLNLNNALEALRNGDFATAADIALTYYDKTYQHCLDNNISPDIRRLPFENGDPVEIAKTLLDIAQEEGTA